MFMLKSIDSSLYSIQMWLFLGANYIEYVNSHCACAHQSRSLCNHVL